MQYKENESPNQQTFNYSKSTMEALKKVWNMVKVNNKNSRTTPDVVAVSLLLTLNILHTFSMVSIDFEQVNVCTVA